jgi:hypothetical protein
VCTVYPYALNSTSGPSISSSRFRSAYRFSTPKVADLSSLCRASMELSNKQPDAEVGSLAGLDSLTTNRHKLRNFTSCRMCFRGLHPLIYYLSIYSIFSFSVTLGFFWGQLLLASICSALPTSEFRTLHAPPAPENCPAASALDATTEESSSTLTISINV